MANILRVSAYAAFLLSYISANETFFAEQPVSQSVSLDSNVTFTCITCPAEFRSAYFEILGDLMAAQQAERGLKFVDILADPGCAGISLAVDVRLFATSYSNGSEIVCHVVDHGTNTSCNATAHLYFTETLSEDITVETPSSHKPTNHPETTFIDITPTSRLSSTLPATSGTPTPTQAQPTFNKKTFLGLFVPTVLLCIILSLMSVLICWSCKNKKPKWLYEKIAACKKKPSTESTLTALSQETPTPTAALNQETTM